MASVTSQVSNEKSTSVCEEEKAQESEAGDASPHTQNPHPWKATVLRARPLSGLFAIGLIICCVFANLAILLTSHHAATASWKYQPSTYLAITTAVVNLALRYACLQGLVIAWWSRASNGSTIKKLHEDWTSGSSFLGAISRGRHMGFLGLACILVTLGAIDGPLLQRAVNVESVSWKDQPVTLNTSMVSEIPTGLTGYWASFVATSTNGVSDQFRKIVPSSPGNTSNNVIAGRDDDFTKHIRQPYFRDHPLRGAIHGCPSVCKANLRAPALAITSCSTTLIPVNYTADAPGGGGRELPLWSHIGFVSVLDLIVTGGQEVVNIVAGHSRTTDCIGTLNMTACTLSSATGEYGVTIHGEDIILDPTGPTIVSLAQNAPVNHSVLYRYDNLPVHSSTLAGIVDLGAEKYDSEAYFTGGTIISDGYPSQQYLVGHSSTCPDWDDPMPDMLLSLNSLMFRTGMWVGMSMTPSELDGKLTSGATINATVVGSLSGTHNVFETNFWYFLAATLLEVLCIFMVLPTYWGFWRLGRSHSFSPLEIAKAFDSPLLQDCDTNSSGQNIAESSLGDTRIRYGAAGTVRRASVASSITLQSPVDVEKICFAEAELVRRPTNCSGVYV